MAIQVLQDADIYGHLDRSSGRDNADVIAAMLAADED
jgi:hypothetical protein